MNEPSSPRPLLNEVADNPRYGIPADTLPLKHSQKFEEEESINTLGSSERLSRLLEMTDSEQAIARGVPKAQLLPVKNSPQLDPQQEPIRHEPVLLEAIPDLGESLLSPEDEPRAAPQEHLEELEVDPLLKEELEYDYYSELPLVLSRTLEPHPIAHVETPSRRPKLSAERASSILTT